MQTLRYPHLPPTHIANVQVGDKIDTPMGIETVDIMALFHILKVEMKKNLV